MKKYLGFKSQVALALIVFISVFAIGAMAATNKANWGDSVYIDSTGLLWAGQGISMGGVTKTSWGSVISPWEDNGTITTLTSAPAKFILTHSTGVSTFTGYIAGTADIVLENGQKIDGGTNNQVIFTDNSDSLDIEFTGNDITLRPSDGGIIFVTVASDATGTFNFQARGDTDDELTIDTISNVPTIGTTGTSNLALVPDGGTVAVTGILTVSGATTVTGILTSSAALTFGNAEEFINTTNGTISMAGTTSPIFDILDEGTGNTDAILSLSADAAADNGDVWRINSDGGTNSLFFENDTSGSQATILTLAKTGILTTTNVIKGVNDSSDTNVVRDILTLTHSSSGTPAAGLGTGISFLVEDGGGVEEQGSIDVVSTDVTDSAENADFVISLNNIGTIREGFRIDTDVTATAATAFEFTSWTIETNGVMDMLELKLENTADTATDGFGMGISIQMEDETGLEERASIDFVQTDAARATNDTDIVFSQDLAGTITETVRFDVDAGTITIQGATPLYFDGATNDGFETILAVADAASSDKTVTLPSITSSIALETVATVVIAPDTTATITVVPGTDQLFTYTEDTDNQDTTLTFSAGGTAGDIVTIIFISPSSGSADEVKTFHGTLSDSEGTLTIADGVSKRYTIRFISDGTIWNEISRTAVLG